MSFRARREQALDVPILDFDEFTELPELIPGTEGNGEKDGLWVKHKIKRNLGREWLPAY